MGKVETRVVKTFEATTETEMVQESLTKAGLQEKHQDKVAGSPFKPVDIRAEAAKTTLNISLSRNGNRGATKKVVASIKRLKMINKRNAGYYEQVAIDTNDPVLITDLGYWFYNPNTKKTRVKNHAKNTNIIGTLLISAEHVAKAKCYKVEGKISGTETLIKFDPIVISKGQNVDNFISGELYLIRTCAVNSKGIDSEWSDYFEIRAR